MTIAKSQINWEPIKNRTGIRGVDKLEEDNKVEVGCGSS